MIKRRFIIFCIMLLGLLVRFYQLTDIPPSLSWDEVSLGYNAYTIATTLHDEHGEFLPLARFIAFGDYKPPGYIYTAVPFIMIFNLNEFSVRFPSALAGVLTILVVYLLVRELFENQKVALITSFFISISPWAVHFSRAAFESNLAMFFNLLGVYFFVLCKRKNYTVVLSYIFFILSFYTFNANRIIAPLLLLSLHLIYLKRIWRNVRWIIISIGISIVLLWPSLGYLSNRESRLRFEEVSIFSNLIPIKISNERIKIDNDSWVAKIIHNRRLFFAEDFLKHYFDNFSGRFLFTHGDGNPRLSLQDMGVLYIIDLPLILLGIFYLLRKNKKSLFVVLVWLFIAPVPAATARETPHALRILSILPAFQILSASGLYYIFKNLLKDDRFRLLRSKIIFLSLLITFVISFYYYLHSYHVHYAIRWSGEWQYGYKQMVNYISEIKDQYDTIFVTSELGRPYIYFAFFEKYPLDQFLKEREAYRDWFGFWNVDALGRYKFRLDSLSDARGKILLVTTSRTVPVNFKIIKTINNLSLDLVFNIAERI